MRHGRLPEENDSNRTWQKRLDDIRSSFANVPRALGMVWQAHPLVFTLTAVVAICQALLPAGQAWTGKLIVDAVVNAIGKSRPLDGFAGFALVIQPAAPFLFAEFFLIALGAVLGQADTLLEHILHARLSNTINNAIIRKAMSLDLQYFEDAKFYDKLQNARREADFRALNIMTTGFQVIRNIITLASFAALLIGFSPWLTVLLFGATVPAFLAQMQFSNLNFKLLSWRAPEARRMNYFEYLLTVDNSAKEVKLFGLGDTLLKRYNALFHKFYKEDSLLARRRSLISVGFGLLSSMTFYAAYAWIIYRTVLATITLGDLTLYLSLCRQAQGLFSGLFSNINSLYESGLFMSNLFGFLELQPQIQTGGTLRKVPEKMRIGIEFRNVSFKYFGKDEFAVKDINLKIKVGEKIALVGQNGAGKTTLIKLLTRLYDPTEGQILLDGIDLREYDVNEWRDHIGVIFQDFVQYQTTVKENIGFGQVKELGDEARILHASEQGGADEVAADLPKQYETMLGRWFERGSELSGGQWQKVALARAFMRDGSVLVLDEPTSALDAEREYEIFQRFRELTAGKIAVLISHRFSTVRMADTIVVLEHGAITELGSHAALVAQGGTYARLFNMQAEGYR